MICNNCFENKNLKKYIEDNGSKVKNGYQCSQCKKIENCSIKTNIFKISKNTLSKKIQEIILTLYEHNNDLGMRHYAEKNICEDGENPNNYAQLKSLESLCFNLFEEEEIIPKLLSENINYRAIKDGEYENL